MDIAKHGFMVGSQDFSNMSRPFKWSINCSYEHFRLDGTVETNDVEDVVWINNTELSLKSDIHKWSFLSFHWSYVL